MKVFVDQIKCKSYGTCVKECPQIFRFQSGNKKAYVIREKVPPELEGLCREMVIKCKANAISIQE